MWFLNFDSLICNQLVLVNFVSFDSSDRFDGSTYHEEIRRESWSWNTGYRLYCRKAEGGNLIILVTITLKLNKSISVFLIYFKWLMPVLESRSLCLWKSSGAMLERSYVNPLIAFPLTLLSLEIEALAKSKGSNFMIMSF